MRFIEDAFVIIHIRLSHIKVKNIEARTLFTFGLLILLIFGLVEFYKSVTQLLGILDFIESALYLVFIIYITFFWLTSWIKANHALNKAYGYDVDQILADKKKRDEKKEESQKKEETPKEKDKNPTENKDKKESGEKDTK